MVNTETAFKKTPKDNSYKVCQGMNFHIPALLCSDIFWQITSSLSQHLRELSEVLAITSGVKLRATLLICIHYHPQD